ncbi:MAG: formate C-acetyltransferase/glycerol dehydratase family glycyl radical enzyme, partial [Acidobacteria bacterium]|nr:formate C-acetyltransferase/glycerol dehydratase family glycyl radical enzyme [Acidobacteriota bacterium]
FDELFEAFRKQIRHFVDIKVRGSNVIEALYAKYLPAPFLSVLVDDCVKTGRDYHAGGARYNTNYIQGVGVGTITDTLSAIRYNVYDHKHFGMAELRAALAADFEGHDALRQRVLNRTPKFGNDDDYADSLMTRVFEAYFEAVDGRPTPRGGAYRINLLPTTAHIYFGKMTGATADGRRAGDAVSEGVSPVQGADRKGPTAVVRSLGKMDHVRTGGTLLNQKFTPQLLAGETGLNGLKDLVRSYFRLMGHHIQFNVVTADLLRTAQAQPEKYRDLIVRVAGYSDYFVDCSTELQQEL